MPTVALRFDRDNPAIGGADPDTATGTDQRGVARDDHPDVGAYEAGGSRGDIWSAPHAVVVLQGTDARDKLAGGKGDDVLRGLGGRDELHGGADDDSVRGNWGKDVLDGGGGSDEISGDEATTASGAGPGRTTSSFTSASAST